MNDLPIILAVEDEALLREMLKTALSEAGFDMTASASSDEALTLFHSGAVKFRALVTDVKIGGSKNGWEVARQVRLQDPSLPVVYMTGAAAHEWPSQGVPNSILLQKPFAPAQLVTALSQLLNQDTVGPASV